ncbi:MAG: PVC-type heme-binding CxxCH protein [Verrucomicrobiota bacterium]
MRLPAFALLASVVVGFGAEVIPFKWSGDLNVPDPTSVTFDEAGNAYVASTTRRKAGDLDIREHRLWIPDDVGLTSPADKLAFYQRELAPGKMKAGRGSLKDHNKDGSVDWKDLTFHQERIYKLTDTDRDGVADKITIFAEGFNSPVSGIAAGVLYFDGWVYVTAIPDVWRLKDTDGDGVADVKEVIATGFGGHIAYAGHDMHGLRLGPDGRIYWTVGDKGANVVSKEGRRFAYPHEGCVLRCEPDGTGFEVFAHGIRNTQEIAFDTFGNVIGVDNDGDQPKERERLIYLLEGSDSGWRNQHQYQATDSRWMKENMWMPAGAADQPLSITPPIANYSDGPAGFLFEPGHALDGDLRGHFILDQFPKGKMDAFTLVPDRDSFRQEDLRVINDGLMGIGMSWAPDGRAYFADWIGGYPLDGKGAIWRMDVAPNVDKTSEAFLSKPFSAEIPKDELLGLLGHRDQRVRVNASIRLHRLGAWSEMLALALKAESPRFARIHAIWGYGMGVRLGKVTDVTASLALLDDADSEIRVQAMKILSEAKTSQLLTDKVASQLSQNDFRVRTQAGITLANLGGKVPMASLWRDAEADLRMPWLRHGLVSGLAGTQSSEELLHFAQTKTGAEAVFSTLALVRHKSPLLAKLLTHANPEVVTEAARAIHDDEGIAAAQPALAAAFGQPNLPFHAARRALNANLRQGDEAALQRVLNWTISQPEGAPLRLEALNTLLVFDLPPALDFVDGTARKYPPREVARLAALIRAKQDYLLKLQRPEERAPALSLLVKYEAALPFPVLQALAEDLKASPGVRLQTLRLLGRLQEENVAVTRTLRNAAGEGNPSEVRIEALNQLFKRDNVAALEVARLIIASKVAKTPEKQAVVAALRGRDEPAAKSLLKDLVTRLASRQLDAGLKLDVFEVAGESTDPAVGEALKNYLKTGGKGAPKLAAPGLPYELLTEGGDAARGKALVNGHLAANCTACHRIDSDEGSEVGPMLRDIGAQRTKAELAESLVAPSAKIVPGFGIESIVLKDGTILAGSVLKETAKSLDFKLADGKTQKVAVAAIASRTPPVSVMPPMLGILTPAEIRDVVAYLSGLKPKATKAKAKK